MAISISENNDQSVVSRYFITYLLPLFVVGWIGTSVSFLRGIFNNNTRWIMLLAGIIYLLTKKELYKFLDLKLIFLLLIYLGWCFFTSFWSSIPILSFAKSTAYFIMLPTLILLGLEWMRTHAWPMSFNYLSIFVFITMISAFFGEHHADKHFYYEGMVGGANMFGFMMVAAYPYLLWNTYTQWKNAYYRIIWLLLSCACVYYIFLCMSRTALVSMILITMGFVASFDISKKILSAFILFGLLLGVLAVKPEVIDLAGGFIKSYIYKGSSTSLLYSRQIPWQLSYQGAEEGGITGLGFGVSFDKDNFNFDNGLTSNSYGREKGNSQLGIIEETGLIGFSLYLLVIAYLAMKTIYIYLIAKRRDQKILAGILCGVFFGCLFSSLFEAWWHTAASPESIYFWIIIGIFQGLEIRIKEENLKYATSFAKA